MLDEQLFDALKQIHASDQGSLCSIRPESERDEHRKAFDYLVLRAYELRKRGYIKFTDGQVLSDNGIDYRYHSMMCNITYHGIKALSYENYDAYRKALSKAPASPVVNNITIVRDAINSNIISGSNNKMK